MRMMKRIVFFLFTALALAGCTDTEQELRERAAELCMYIPDHELLAESKDYLTEDFYALLDTMFYRLPEHEAMDHEWLYYFVTGNGGTMADFEVTQVERTDKRHAVATILVRQVWEDGSYAEETDLEEHKLYMEKVNGKWLMADFDGHKEDCSRYIANNRREQALRRALSDYLIREIGPHYLRGELCIPTLMIVAEEEEQVWGDFWIFWYNTSGDTLKTVSGGSHPGVMTIRYDNGSPIVASFEQVEDGAQFLPSAERIFKGHYDIFHNMHANQTVREAVRHEQLVEYIRDNRLNIHYYQDYGWPAVKLE